MPRRKSITAATPWWLGGGTEICSRCHQPYTLENERRCAGCDEGLCEHCAMHVHGSADVYCSTCHAEPEED